MEWTFCLVHLRTEGSLRRVQQLKMVMTLKKWKMSSINHVNMTLHSEVLMMNNQKGLVRKGRESFGLDPGV